MFKTPNAVVRAARSGLSLIFAATLLLIVRLPAQGSDGDGWVQAAALFAAGFGGLMLAMLAFPWQRKSDLLIAGAAASALVLVLARIGGNDAAGQLGIAIALGVLAAYLPANIERTRRHARAHGDELFEVLTHEDRRVRRARRTRPAAAVAGK